MIVSSYQYHMVSSESWLKTTGHQARLQNSTLYDGLEIEYTRTVNYDIQQMIDFYSFMQDGERKQDVFTVRLEHLRDELNFRIIEAAMKRWFGADARKITPWHELEKCCFVSPDARKKGSNHISKTDEKASMRQIIMERHGEDIRHLRRQLGFSLIGAEEKENASTTESRATSLITFEGKNIIYQKACYVVILLTAAYTFAQKRSFPPNRRNM
mmetsp:Transcript_24877/g.31693  ORF Transcript_24877/g.31693 Transcript_24877/m.31693 type:complete len:213 (+) Transcript_24877:432-1070(+)